MYTSMYRDSMGTWLIGWQWPGIRRDPRGAEAGHFPSASRFRSGPGDPGHHGHPEIHCQWAPE